MMVDRVFCACPRFLSNYRLLNIKSSVFRRAIINLKPATASILVQQQRTYSLKRYVDFENKQGYWAGRDNIPDSYELIYKTSKNPYVTVTVFFTIISSASLAILIFFNILTSKEIPFEPYMVSETQAFVSSIKELYVCGAFFTIMALITIILARRFVLRIYRNGNNYVAIYASYIPRVQRRMDFIAGDVYDIPPIAATLPWSRSLFKINGRKSILTEHNFKSFNDLKLMMGGRTPKEVNEESDEFKY